jgi:hypothetical protein
VSSHVNTGNARMPLNLWSKNSESRKSDQLRDCGISICGFRTTHCDDHGRGVRRTCRDKSGFITHFLSLLVQKERCREAMMGAAFYRLMEIPWPRPSVPFNQDYWRRHCAH